MDDQATLGLQDFQKLLGVLRTPANLQEQLEGQEFLQANPALMAVFTRRRESAILDAYAKDREWTKSVTPEERNDQISVIFSRLNDVPLLVNPGDAMEVEFMAYVHACSREEYYRLLAEKTRQLESDLKEKVQE